MPRMHPAVRALIDVVWQMPFVALPFALFFGTLFGATARDYILAYKLSLVFGFSISLGLWGVKQFVRPRVMRLEGGRTGRANFQIGVWISTVCIVMSYLAAYIIHRTLLPGFLGSPRAVAVSGMFTLLFTGLFGGINYAILFYRQAVDRARAVEQIRAELAQAEVRALRAQINPHFLFNTLNTIAALIAENPAAAEDITTRLAEVFRYTLTASGREHARLGDELDFLRNYLAIEHARYEDRLRFEESIEPGLDAALVPSMLLQPLVENAVRYGVSARDEGGTVRLSARRDGSLLVIEIADDGPGMRPEAAASGNGFGLHSVRERLRVAGAPHAIDIDGASGHGTRVRITLPLAPRETATLPEPHGESTS
jgi:sensor histidine kinase YesM